MELNKNHRSDELPLAGLRFLVTRMDNEEPSVTKMLESKGASVIVIPMTKIVDPSSWDLFDKTVSKFEKIDWAIFTSSNGVSRCLKRLGDLNHSPIRIFSKIKIACVGLSTSNRLVKNGIVPKIVPTHFQTEDLIYALKKYKLKGKKIWLIQAEFPRKLLIKELKKQESEVIFTPVYKTEPILGDNGLLILELEQSKLDWILFGSPSAVKNFQKILPKGLWLSLSNIPKIGCIGQITAEAVQDFGWKVEAKPNVQDFEHLVQKVCEINSKKSDISNY